MPSELVFLVLSLPAKSTKCSFEKRTLSADSTLDLLSIYIVKIVCAREDASLSLCSLTVLFNSPSNKQFSASSSLSQTT